MGNTVYYSDPTLTTAAGFGRVAYLPCILDSRPGYHRTASRYLIDRGCGLWNPLTRGRAVRGVAPTPRTIRNYADWLVNFLDWAEARGIDLSTCDYIEHVQGRYQEDMLSGRWARDAVALSPRTVNLRVTQACDYLTWMADKGLRTPFDVPQEVRRIKTGSATNSIGHKPKEVSVRKGKVRQNKRRLRMPTDDQVKAWLTRVYEQFGPTKGLMCETILLTAVRRAEVACWRTDTLPERREDWHLADPHASRSEQRVLVNISFGTKGPSYGRDHGDKIGPARDIWLPLELAERLDQYRMKSRNPALRLWVNSAKTAQEKQRRIKDTVHLFLDETTGHRIGDKQLYDAWCGVDLPYKGWSPHLGRDWWSCSILWREIKKHDRLVELGIDTPVALLESTVLGIIRFHIQPQLGHADDKTSMIYLQWAADMLGVNLSIQYEAELDGMESTG